eukprot:4912311-Pyramimonas_sp.AAC.1
MATTQKRGEKEAGSDMHLSTNLKLVRSERPTRPESTETKCPPNQFGEISGNIWRRNTRMRRRVDREEKKEDKFGMGKRGDLHPLPFG